MTSPSQRSSLALADARAVVDRLDPAADPEDLAANLIEGWRSTENVIRAMIGGSPLSGQLLISAARQRNLLTLDQAHALLEFLAAHDRASRTDYRPTGADIAAARAGLASLEAGSPVTPADVPSLANTTAFQAMPRPMPGSGAGEGAAAPPPASDAAAPALDGPRERRDRLPQIFIGAAVLLLVAVVVAVFAFGRGSQGGVFGGGVDHAVGDGIASYRAGRLERARGQFEEAARKYPDAALPHLWLARVARDQREDSVAARELSAAERLEPSNHLVHREIGNFHMARGRWDFARQRYVKAVQLDPADTVAQGWLGCALVRLGRLEEGRKWMDRAGPGDWTRCAAQTVPGAPGAPMGQGAAAPPAFR
ncbi:MAG TPA: tetratricopeptide repeat protein [Gemmatimonadaceae bacterium]|nr:tetratricopeptide repeat protein [Gemmatimonadaceae bacterium]